MAPSERLNPAQISQNKGVDQIRAAAVARLPRSLLDPELFPHTAYVKILATLARKTVN